MFCVKGVIEKLTEKTKVLYGYLELADLARSAISRYPYYIDVAG